MLILTVRTDKPEAEIGLYDNQRQLAYVTWQAHRELAETIQQRIDNLLRQQGKQLSDLRGAVVFKGPGSFTGLRIGLSVANALAYALKLPIVAGTGDDWLLGGIAKLVKGQNEQITLPEYGAEPHITRQKK